MVTGGWIVANGWVVAGSWNDGSKVIEDRLGARRIAPATKSEIPAASATKPANFERPSDRMQAHPLAGADGVEALGRTPSEGGATNICLARTPRLPTTPSEGRFYPVGLS